MKFLLGIVLCAFCVSTLGTDFPFPLEFGPTNSYSRNLQRSLRLMADSPPTKKRTVKVLFYGQSITLEVWTNWFRDYMRARFPNANLVITNLSMSGYESPVLSRLAVDDIPGFYPDLMIFQDYGPSGLIEEMIALARKQTAADILIQTDHLNFPEDLDEPTDPNLGTSLPDRARRNYVDLPTIARRYGAELADVRTYWKRYLLDFNLKTQDLLRDNVHPNLQGNFVMDELLKPYLRVDPSFASTEWRAVEKLFTIGKDVDWTNDVLSLTFTGNRIDLIADASSNDPIEVRIDGRRPSEFPELYRFTRTGLYPGSPWLPILRISSQKPLLEENWTARITEFTTDTSGIPFARFQVSGSRTGPDGEGSITNSFTSNSGRIVIEPFDWIMLSWTAPNFGNLPVGYEIHWSSVFAGKDEFIPQVTDPTIESTVTVAQGLGSGTHTLRLTRHGSAPISAIRIYNPLARPQPLRQAAPELTALKRENNTCALNVNVSGRYVIESSIDGRTWQSETAPRIEAETILPEAGQLRLFRARSLD